MTSLQFEQWVPFPLEKVFRFFADPHNLPRIMPPNTGTRILEIKPPLSNENEHRAGPGTEVIMSFRPIPLLPFRQQWIALITEFEWNHHFADVQKQGPFESWHHRHEFSAQTERGITGTIVRDFINYEVGFGLMGKIADKLFVRSTFDHMFAYRRNAMEKLFR